MLKLTAGIDIGFGDVKVVAKGNEGPILRYKFPSAIKAGATESLGFSTGERIDITRKYTLLLDGTQIFVGNGILGRLGSSQYIGSEKSERDYLILTAFVLGAIAAEHEEDSLSAVLTLGFPLKSSKEFKEKITKDITELGNVTLKNTINDKTREINLDVKRIYRLAQGKGAFIAELQPEVVDGQDAVARESVHYLSEYTLVIDIGSNTINPLFMRNGQVDSERSKAHFNAGVIHVVDAIQLALQERGVPLDRRTVQEEILKKDPAEYEDVTDIREIRRKAIQDAWENYAGKTIEGIIKEGRAEYGKPHNLIFCGGGAIVFKEFIRKEFAGKYQVIIPRDPVFANAEGYYMWTNYAESVRRYKENAQAN